MGFDEFFRSESKIFTKKSIGFATLFGGPIVTGYMISENFKAFDEKDKAKWALINGLLGTAIFISILIAVPERYMALIPAPVLSSLVPGLVTLFGVLWMERVQGQQIKEHLDQGGGTYSRWKAVGIGCIGLLFTIILAGSQSLAVSLLSPEMEGKKIAVSDNKNRVYYEGMDSATAASIVEALRTERFFDVNYDSFFKIESTPNGYRFLFPATKEYWNNPDLVGHYVAFKSFLEQRFPDKNIDFALFSVGFSGREFREIHYQDSLPLDWMKRPSVKETAAQIAHRVHSYLSFWEQFFQFGVDAGAEELQWPVIPNALNFASNGLALIESDMLPEQWKRTFYDEESASQAYTILGRSFSGVSWAANANVFKSYVHALGQMKVNVKKIQMELSDIPESTPPRTGHATQI